MFAAPPKAAGPHALDAYAQAVLLCFDLAASASGAQRDMLFQAQAFCEQQETGPSGWSLALRLLCQTNDSRTAFHCLQVLQRKLEDPAHWSALHKTGDNITIRLTLLQRDVSADPRFVRTKLGVVLALFIKREFPRQWPSAFDDVLATLSRGEAAADVLLWTLVALEEEVISVAGPEATEIKDAMRIDAVRKLVQALIHLFVTRGDSDQDLARRSLSILGSMISWADISLVVDNSSFMGVVLDRLSSPHYASTVLQFLARLVLKGMPPLAKARLIANLGLADVVVAMSSALPRNELRVSAPHLSAPLAVEAWARLKSHGNQLEASLETARLVDAIGLELLEARKAAKEVHDEGLVQSINPVLERVVWAMFACLESSVFQVQSAVVEFANQVHHHLPDQAHASRLAYAVLNAARYPDDYDFSLDDDEEFVDHRRLVKRLFINLCRHSGQTAVVPFFLQAVPAVLNPSPSLHFADFSQTESLLFLVHAFAEGCPELAQHQGAPDQLARFDELLRFVFKSNAPMHPHHAVVIMFNELVARYAICLKAQPGEVMQHVIATLSGPGGVYHANPKVRSRACAVLLRLVRALSDKGVLLFEPLLVTLRPALDLGIESAGRDCSDALVLYEVVGVLMSAAWAAPLRRGAVSLIVLPLQGNLETATMQWQSCEDPNEKERLLAWIVVSVEALSVVVKGFSSSRDVDVAAVLARVFQSALLAAQTVRLPPGQPNRVVSNVRRLGHALIPSLGITMVAYLPAIISALLEPADAEVGKTCDLINQMMATFRSAMAPALSESLVPLLRAINAHLAPLLSVTNPTPNDRDEAREMEKVLLVLLHSIASCELSSVLLAPINRPHLFELLGLLADALGTLPDAGAQRVCASTLQLLARDWLPLTPERDGTGELHAPLVRFLYERASPASFRASSLPTFDHQDAACASLLVAVCALHRTLFERCGREWLDYLLQVFFPSVHCPPDVAEEYCMAIVESKSPKELRASYRRLFAR